MKFAAAVIPDLPPEGRQVLERIADLKGNDKISMTAEPIPNGQRFRIQLDEVAIKAIGMSWLTVTTRQSDPLGF